MFVYSQHFISGWNYTNCLCMTGRTLYKVSPIIWIPGVSHQENNEQTTPDIFSLVIHLRQRL
jgi:hypothetical protein